MKYIIEIKPEYEDSFKGVMILGAKDSNLFVDTLAVENLEELNSDYINEHFGELQDTAYQRGSEDSWEAAKKIAEMWTRIGNEELLAIFGIFERIGRSTIRSLFEKQTASEAIAKLKAYEKKQADKITVGDEVKYKEYKNRFVVTKMQDGYVYGISKDGSWNNFRNDGSIVKTGRHFDIDKILEEMKE